MPGGGAPCGWALCKVSQDKARLNDFYTRDRPANIAKQREQVAEAKAALVERESELAAYAGTATAERQALETAVAEARCLLDERAAPRNFPVNFVVAQAGGQAFADTVNIWHEAAPRNHTAGDDIISMYNETSRQAAFVAQQQTNPSWVPGLRYYYGDPASIRIVRSEGRMRASLLADGDDADAERAQIDMGDHPDIRANAILAGLSPAEAAAALHEALLRMPDAAYITSDVGGHQGDPVATDFSCRPTHLLQHQVQQQYPTLRIASLADDGAYNAPPHILYAAFAYKRTLAWDLLRQSTHDGKLAVHAPLGDWHLMPPGYTHAPCLKLAGCFVGADDEACAQALAAKVSRKHVNLDRMDAIEDSERHPNTLQIRLRLLTRIASHGLDYWASAMRPARVQRAALASDARVLQSFIAIARAEVSPEERQQLAHKQAFLPTHMAGAGLEPQQATANAKYAGGFLRRWALLKRTMPCLSQHSLADSQLPTIAAARAAYETVCAQRDECAQRYAAFDLDLYHACDGSTAAQPRFRPASLPRPTPFRCQVGGACDADNIQALRTRAGRQPKHVCTYSHECVSVCMCVSVCTACICVHTYWCQVRYC